MISESTPPSEAGPAQDNGPAQGHRRRRRRRKNKPQQTAGQAQPQGQTHAPPAEPQPKPAAAQQGRGQGHSQSHSNQGHNQNQGRKKKKFFQKTQAPQSPGNSTAPQQGRRKTRQKGPREFVGPMDHSYRAVNGNVADGPPSTIQLGSSNHHGSYYPDAYATASAPVRENAPTRIFCFIEDLFFLAKIQEAARKLGVKVEFVKGGDKDAVARIAEAPESERPALLVFDLNNLSAKPMTLIPKFRAKYKRAISIIGFLSHLQGDLKLKAIEVGCDTVMPRSAFSQSLPNLLRRYGVEEEEDLAPQPA